MVERDSNRLIRLDIIYKVNYHYLDTAIQIFRDNLIDKLEQYTNYTLLNAYPDEVITGKKYDQTFHQIDRNSVFLKMSCLMGLNKTEYIKNNAYCFPAVAKPFMKTKYILRKLEEKTEYLLKHMMRSYDPAGFQSTLRYISINRL